MSSTPPPAATDAALRSVHTSNLPALFGQLQVSVVIATYQAGKVILIRNDEGVLNTHFRTFGKPMGIAGDRARLTIGGTNTVWYYRNLPAVAGKLEPPGTRACGSSGRTAGKTGKESWAGSRRRWSGAGGE